MSEEFQANLRISAASLKVLRGALEITKKVGVDSGIQTEILNHFDSMNLHLDAVLELLGNVADATSVEMTY